MRFSSFKPDKLFRFYLENLLLAAAGAEGISGKIIFSTQKGIESRVLPPFTRDDAIRELTSLTAVALRICTSEMPLPLFANASFARAKHHLDQTQSDKAAAEFEGRDLKYNKVIERFYTADVLNEDEFDTLARAVYTSVASFKEIN